MDMSNIFKKNVSELIEKGHTKVANRLLQEYNAQMPDDADTFILLSKNAFKEEDYAQAKDYLIQGVKTCTSNLDILLEMGSLLEKMNEIENASIYYKKALLMCSRQDDIDKIQSKLRALNAKNIIAGDGRENTNHHKKKVAFFHKAGMDSFLHDIIAALSTTYEIKKIQITENADLKLIDHNMEWCDVSWFEWCDELLVYGSRLPIARNRIILCRIHRYEVFTDYPQKVNWNNVDKLIVVTEHLKHLLSLKIPDVEKIVDIVTVNNGVNLQKYNLIDRKRGHHIAYVGYIHHRKNPSLLLQIIEKLTRIDPRYKLFVAGSFQDPLLELFWKYQVEQMNIQNNVLLCGWQKDINKWLQDKSYILSTSIHESFGYGIAEAMAQGVKPIIHNFVYAASIWDSKYLFNTVDQAVDMITENSYESVDYRSFIAENYSLDKQVRETMAVISSLLLIGKKKSFDYDQYWNSRLNDRFNIEGVGYIGLGETYNTSLYRNRIEAFKKCIESLEIDKASMKVLEIGPGIGVFTRQFKEFGIKHYHAVDISRKSVSELTNKYPDYRFTHGNVAKLEMLNEKYDLILAADVLLHITDEEDYSHAIRTISNALSNEGLCILMDPISVLEAKSTSPHVVIRDIEYVRGVLARNGLKVTKMLPLTYFMNFPFDSEAIGKNGDVALKLFNNIYRLFSNNEITDIYKEMIADYLVQQDRQLLISQEIGLSEKLLIIQQDENLNELKLDLSHFFSADADDKMSKLIKEIQSENEDFIETMGEIFDGIEFLRQTDCEKRKDKTLVISDVLSRLNEFYPYSKDEISMFDFQNAKLLFGKKEALSTEHVCIDFVVENRAGSRIVIGGIIKNITTGKYTLPSILSTAINVERIIHFLEEVERCTMNPTKGIEGFVLDSRLAAEIERDRMAFIWERGIPGSEFMPLLGYYRIAERYLFAGKHVTDQDSVLEAPSGYGYGAAYLSNKCKYVQAVDIARDNIEFAKMTYGKPNINWAVDNVTKLKFDSDTFDVYISYEVLEHLEAEDVGAYLFEAKRVIKNNGKFILSTPYGPNRKSINNPYHRKEFAFYEFKITLEAYFQHIEYYHVSQFTVERGLSSDMHNMIAVCSK